MRRKLRIRESYQSPSAHGSLSRAAHHRRGETARVPTSTSFETGAELEHRLGQEKACEEIESQGKRSVLDVAWPVDVADPETLRDQFPSPPCSLIWSSVTVRNCSLLHKAVSAGCEN